MLIDINSGSKINFFEGQYYLYGNSFAVEGSSSGLKLYSSDSLTAW